MWSSSLLLPRYSNGIAGPAATTTKRIEWSSHGVDDGKGLTQEHEVLEARIREALEAQIDLLMDGGGDDVRSS